MTRSWKPYSPEEARTLALKLGWTVRGKHRHGEWCFISPTGDRFLTGKAGNTKYVPLKLAQLLYRAELALKGKKR